MKPIFKKYLLAVFCIAFIVILSSCSFFDKNKPTVTEEHVENLIKNGSFEDVSSDGSVISWKKTDGATFFKDNASDGQTAASLTSGASLTSINTLVDKMSSYYVSFDVMKKSENSQLVFSSSDSENKYSIPDSVPVGEWYTVKINLNTGCSSLISLIFTGDNDVMIDNIQLYPLHNKYIDSTDTYLSDIAYESYQMSGNPGINTDGIHSGIELGGVINFDKGIHFIPCDNKISEITYKLSGQNKLFAYAGTDYSGNDESEVRFTVFGDEKILYETSWIKYGEYSILDVDISGYNTLKIAQETKYDTCGGCLCDAVLSTKVENGVTIIKEPNNSSFYNTTDNFELSGFACCDEVAVLVNGKQVGDKITVTANSFKANLSNIKEDSFDLTVQGYANSHVSGSGNTVKVSRKEKSVNLTDLKIDQYSSSAKFLRNNLATYSIGNGKINSDSGIVIIPPKESKTNKDVEYTVNMQAVNFSVFTGDIGILDSDANSDSSASVTFLADEKELFKTDTLKKGDCINVAVEIPNGTEKFIIRVSNENGSIKGDSVAFLNSVFYSNAQEFKDIFNNTYCLTDNTDCVCESKIDDVYVQIKTDSEFRGIKVDRNSLPDNFYISIYKWSDSYQNTIQQKPVLTVDFSNSDYGKFGIDENIIPFSYSLPSGEYLLICNGDGDIPLYKSDKAITYLSNDSINACPEMEIVSDSDLLSVENDDTAYTAISNVASDDEKEIAYNTYHGFIDDLSCFPSTVSIGSCFYKGFGQDFKEISRKIEKTDSAENTIITLQHLSSGLIFQIDSSYYYDYAAYKWVINIENTTNEDSLTVSNLKVIQHTFEGENPIVHTSTGDSDRFSPVDKEVDGVLSFSPETGRSSEGVFPYYNFEYGQKGMLFAIGWAGQWEASFNNSSDNSKTMLTIGQQSFASILKPGEKIQTPIFAAVMYNSRNQRRAVNLWRKYFINNEMHRVSNNELFKPMIAGSTSAMYEEMINATDENQKQAISTYLNNNINLDYWWMDAGWYSDGNKESLPNWQGTGSWIVDIKKFPSAFSDISSFALKKGVKTLLWFEPERAGLGTEGLKSDGSTIKPEWLINDLLVNLSVPDAEQWITNRIVKIMKSGGISLYREDFNIYPISYWQSVDADQGILRKGITENLYLQAHFRVWDTILKTFPDEIIDSCASGGNRNDFETMTRAVPLHKTDYMYSDSAAQQCYATGYAAWIPYYGSKTDSGDNSANKYMLRTALVPSMIMGYDYTSSVDWDIIRDVVEEHDKLSQFYYDDFYELTDYSRDDTDWYGWEYYTQQKGEGFALLFRRGQAQESNTVKLMGLDPMKNYYIWFEDKNDLKVYSGIELMRHGLTISLPCANSSDIMYIRDTSLGEINNRELTGHISFVSNEGKYGAAIENKDGFNYVDLRFNMSLRNTSVSVNESTFEKNVEKDYLDNFEINGASAKSLYDAGELKMDYDVENNIIRIYISENSHVSFNAKSDNVISVKSLKSYDGTEMKDCMFTYNAEIGKWHN